MDRSRESQETVYRDIASEFGAAILRLAAAYEVNPERKADLVQDIHLALWKSLATYANHCSLRTWVYRVAHNTAAAYVLREQRARVGRWIELEHADHLSDGTDLEAAIAEAQAREAMMRFIQRLKLPDRQVIVLYLEGLDATLISEITTMSPGSINTRIYRFKALLGQKLKGGASL